jgi:hypothetical protein
MRPTTNHLPCADRIFASGLLFGGDAIFNIAFTKGFL